jgi:beta-glucanase (GH16 family)
MALRVTSAWLVASLALCALLIALAVAPDATPAAAAVDKRCSDFSDHLQVRHWLHRQHMKGRRLHDRPWAPSALDGDQDRRSCEHLPCPCSHPSRSRHRPSPAGTVSPTHGSQRTKVGSSGKSIPSGHSPGWKRVFADDFNKTVRRGRWPGAVHRKWGKRSYPDGWSDTSGNGTYYPSRVVSQHDSKLDLYLHTEHGVHMVAAPVPTVRHAAGRRGGLRYGRYAVRFKADPLRCYKTAWLLWPDSGVWPGDGEIDFPEAQLTDRIGGYVHHRGATSRTDQDAFSWHARYKKWHTAVIAWRPGRVNLILDGATKSTSHRVPNKPMHWVLQTETSTKSGCTPNNATRGHVLIDWVAVWRRARGVRR